jgi:hypothetical protein
MLKNGEKILLNIIYLSQILSDQADTLDSYEIDIKELCAKFSV